MSRPCVVCWSRLPSSVWVPVLFSALECARVRCSLGYGSPYFCFCPRGVLCCRYFHLHHDGGPATLPSDHLSRCLVGLAVQWFLSCCLSTECGLFSLSTYFVPFLLCPLLVHAYAYNVHILYRPASACCRAWLLCSHVLLSAKLETST